MRKKLIVFIALLSMLATPVLGHRIWRNAATTSIAASTNQLIDVGAKSQRYNLSVHNVTAGADITFVTYSQTGGAGDSVVHTYTTQSLQSIMQEFYGPPARSFRISTDAGCTADLTVWW